MYNNDSDSLNAGAPEIRLSGNQQMAMSDPSPGSELFQMYQNALQSGQIPQGTTFEMFKELLQQSRAPQQNSGIMASGPGTYTQQRKQMMAGGGIAGLKQIGKPGGLVEPGISKYGMFDFITDPIKSVYEKFVDDIIPNEIKENPVATAALIGGGINQFGLPDFLVPDFIAEGSNVGQNWLGNLLGNINPNLSDMVIGDTAEEKAAALSQPSGYFGSDTTTGRNKFLEAMGVIPSTPSSGLVNYALQQLQGGGGGGGGGLTGMFSSALSPYLGEEGDRRVNPLYPLGIGAAVGKYVEGLPKDELPMDTTSIDPAAIAAAARGTDAEGAAAGLRFLPEQVTRAAEGGRIGYAKGEKVDSSETRQLLDIIRRLLKQRQGEGITTLIRKGRKGREGELFTPDRNPYDGRERSAPIDPNNPFARQYKGPKLAPMPKMEFSEDFFGDPGIYREPNRTNLEKLLDDTPMFSQGGRIGAQEGGLMNLGGMEKDYRNEGGFVALGGKEKADDVPARLSKNEFVFTADAVRGAGGGDIDQGAEIMENMMKHLEAGGEVSEDSQGLEGARGMFANAQKLQNRIV